MIQGRARFGKVARCGRGLNGYRGESTSEGLAFLVELSDVQEQDRRRRGSGL